MTDFVLQPKPTQAPTAPQGRAGVQSQSQSHSDRPRTPSHDDIARRAYELYVKSGRQQGHCQRNWHQAEQELKHQAQALSAAQRGVGEPSSNLHVGSEPVVRIVTRDVPPGNAGRASGRSGATSGAPQGRDASA